MRYSAESSRKFKGIVIGGGISGLTAAYRLKTLAEQNAIPVEITVLDKAADFGGVIQTDHENGFLLEGGPDSFITDKPWALDLARELGLEKEFCPTNPEKQRSFIDSKGRLIPVPAGFYLMAPTSLAPLWNQPLISFWGKLRMAFEFFIPPKKGDGDESVAHFIRRRFGEEALVKIGQPMIGGIYSADPEKLSLKATFPQFLEMEKKSGSVMRALFKKRNQSQSEKKASGPRYGLFLSFKEGISVLIRTLIERLRGQGVCLRTSAKVTRIQKTDHGWMVFLEDGSQLAADCLCLGVPAPHAASLLFDLYQDLAKELKAIPYESVATLNMVFHRKDIGHPLDGFGYVVPACEKKNVIGCTFSSVKFPGRSPDENHVLLRAFAGGAMHRSLFSMSDEELKQTVVEEVKKTLNIQAGPASVLLRRWMGSMPQYHVGHSSRVKRIDDLVSELEGLYLTGNAYEGIGLPDCIRHASNTAGQMLSFLRQKQNHPEFSDPHFSPV